MIFLLFLFSFNLVCFFFSLKIIRYNIFTSGWSPLRKRVCVTIFSVISGRFCFQLLWKQNFHAAQGMWKKMSFSEIPSSRRNASGNKVTLSPYSSSLWRKCSVTLSITFRGMFGNITCNHLSFLKTIFLFSNIKQKIKIFSQFQALGDFVQKYFHMIFCQTWLSQIVFDL